MTTPTTTPHPDLPVPAGAREVEAWDYRERARNFYGGSWVIPGEGWCPDGFQVYIYGTQHFSGEVQREIVAGVLHPDNPITSAQARQLARALMAAADELDALDALDALDE